MCFSADSMITNPGLINSSGVEPPREVGLNQQSLQECTSPGLQDSGFCFICFHYQLLTTTHSHLGFHTHHGHQQPPLINELRCFQRCRGPQRAAGAPKHPPLTSQMGPQSWDRWSPPGVQGVQLPSSTPIEPLCLPGYTKEGASTLVPAQPLLAPASGCGSALGSVHRCISQLGLRNKYHGLGCCNIRHLFSHGSGAGVCDPGTGRPGFS